MSKFHHHFEIVKVEKFCILNEFPSQKVQIWRSLLTNKVCWWNLLIFKMYSCIRAIKTLPHEWVLYTAMYLNQPQDHSWLDFNIVSTVMSFSIINNTSFHTRISLTSSQGNLWHGGTVKRSFQSVSPSIWSVLRKQAPEMKIFFLKSKFMDSSITLFWHIQWISG